MTTQSQLRSRTLSRTINDRRRTRSMPVAPQVVTSVNQPKGLTEEEYKKQLEEYNKELDAYNKEVAAFEKSRQSEINDYQAQLEKYKNDLEKYNLDKAEYDRQVEEYNKKKAEYDAAKEAYDKQLEDYNREETANRQAFNLYNNAVYNGVNPGLQYLRKDDPLVYKYYMYYQNRDEIARNNELLNKATTLQEYEKAYNEISSEFQMMYKSPEQIRKDLAFNPPPTPEGYQGVSTPQGIIFEEIPNKPTYQATTISPTKVSAPSMSLTYSEPTTNGLGQVLAPPTSVLPTIREKSIIRSTSILGPAPSFKTRIKEDISKIKLGARNVYGKIFEEEPSMDRLTVRKAAGEISTGLFVKAPKQLFGETPALVADTIGFQGIKSTAPSKTIPQMVTVGGEFKVKEQDIFFGTPNDIKFVGGLIGEGAKYTLVPAPILFAAGASILTAPKNAQISNQEKIEGGFMTLPLVGKSIGKAVKVPKDFLFAKQIKALPKEQPLYTPYELVEPISVGNRQFERGSFLLKVETPAQKAELSSRFGRLIGKKPEIVTISKPRTDVVFTVRPIVTERVGEYSVVRNNAWIASARVGKNTKSFTITNIVAAQKPVKNDVVYGSIEATKVGRANIRTGRFDLLPPGKRTTRAETASISQPIENDKLTNIQLYKTGTIVGDVTKPFARTKKNVPYLEGFTVVKQPRDLNPTDSFSVSTRLVTKDKSGMDNILKQAQQAGLKNIPKQKSSQLPKSIIKTEPSKNNAVSSVGLATSEYYGKSFVVPQTYQQEFIPVTKSITKNNVSTSSSQVFYGFNKSKGATISIPKSQLKPKELSIQQDFVRPADLNRERPKFAEKFNLASMTVQAPALKNAQINLTKLKQVQKTVQVPKQRSVPKESIVPKFNTKTTTTITPKIPIIPIVPPKQKKYESYNKNEDKFSKAFDVVVRRKGKLETVGTKLTYNKALKLGSDISKRSTVQTFALKESGVTKEQDINYRVRQDIFSAPKKKKTYITPLTFTERRGKTLTERKEVTDILKEKRRNTKYLF